MPEFLGELIEAFMGRTPPPPAPVTNAPVSDDIDWLRQREQLVQQGVQGAGDGDLSRGVGAIEGMWRANEGRGK